MLHKIFKSWMDSGEFGWPLTFALGMKLLHLCEWQNNVDNILNWTAGYWLASFWWVGSIIVVRRLKDEGSTFHAPVTDDLNTTISDKAARSNITYL